MFNDMIKFFLHNYMTVKFDVHSYNRDEPVRAAATPS